MWKTVYFPHLLSPEAAEYPGHAYPSGLASHFNKCPTLKSLHKDNVEFDFVDKSAFEKAEKKKKKWAKKKNV